MKFRRFVDPFHPGEILLEEFVMPLGWSQRAFAAELGWSPRKLNEIVRGKRGISGFKQGGVIADAGGIDSERAHDILELFLTGCGGRLDDLLRGRVGLALSGGGFRASLYHIGVLAKLAELDVLRHVEVLSCVFFQKDFFRKLF